ncbi:hypothetical protein CMQ_541 [Grosmannia clavigera kw1407]|uniref:Uncharacterized protein n=1 Tax=Grosmannia clavigera (strain kw1407 / UAMH 11150) TaxID=655863 RepID=F0XEF1_GROCL|nr:uncharacterized protein CMQ_541 [Grosmannia clavigera kw1407]EFX03613.1 hypothetical protein CMQ_541 [Grosmannia clavigera kw1407]
MENDFISPTATNLGNAYQTAQTGQLPTMPPYVGPTDTTSFDQVNHSAPNAQPTTLPESIPANAAPLDPFALNSRPFMTHISDAEPYGAELSLLPL